MDDKEFVKSFVDLFSAGYGVPVKCLREYAFRYLRLKRQLETAKTYHKVYDRVSKPLSCAQQAIGWINVYFDRKEITRSEAESAIRVLRKLTPLKPDRNVRYCLQKFVIKNQISLVSLYDLHFEFLEGILIHKSKDPVIQRKNLYADIAKMQKDLLHEEVSSNTIKSEYTERVKFQTAKDSRDMELVERLKKVMKGAKLEAASKKR